MHELGHSIGISWFGGIDNTSYGLPRFPNKNYLYKDYRSVMNYQCIYEYTVLDYSDGANGPPFDQNDWQKIFVANFNYNAQFVYGSSHSKINYVDEGFDSNETGYIYDENLTRDIIDSMGGYSPVDPITVEWAALKLVEEDKYPQLKEVKILVKPNSPRGVWILFSEGKLDSNGKIQFYSQEEIIKNIVGD